jgi:hypothetical protein
VGRRGSYVVEPGGIIGGFIDDYVPGGHAFGERHDNLVEQGHALGVPDLIVNVPTMPFTYVETVVDLALGN